MIGGTGTTYEGPVGALPDDAGVRFDEPDPHRGGCILRMRQVSRVQAQRVPRAAARRHGEDRGGAAEKKARLRL